MFSMMSQAEEQSLKSEKQQLMVSATRLSRKLVEVGVGGGELVQLKIDYEAAVARIREINDLLYTA
jgi:hypothetical protein